MRRYFTVRYPSFLVEWFCCTFTLLPLGFVFGQLPSADLTMHEPNFIPSGTTFEWHVGASAGSAIVNTPTAVSPGVYYGFLNFGSGCYSTGSPINVIANICPATTIDLISGVDTTNLPSGTMLSFHSALPVSDANEITGSSITSASPGTYYVCYKKTISGFSCYSEPAPIAAVLSTVNCSLPVEMTFFKAVLNENVVDLKWQTASEINNDFFTLDKSVDGTTWTFLKQIDGAGNSVTILDYHTVDPMPGRGVVYYRLSQTDFNGEQNTPSVQAINLENSQRYEVFPNPFSDYITIHAIQPNEMLRIYSAKGSLVYSQILEDKLNSINLSHLDQGVYFLHFQSDFHKLVKK